MRQYSYFCTSKASKSSTLYVSIRTFVLVKQVNRVPQNAQQRQDGAFCVSIRTFVLSAFCGSICTLVLS